jgi:hypothetical protein
MAWSIFVFIVEGDDGLISRSLRIDQFVHLCFDQVDALERFVAVALLVVRPLRLVRELPTVFRNVFGPETDEAGFVSEIVANTLDQAQIIAHLLFDQIKHLGDFDLRR